MPPPGQRREGARDDRIGCGASRGDTARDKGRGVELVVGEQNEAAADQNGAPLVATAQPRELRLSPNALGRPGAPYWRSPAADLATRRLPHVDPLATPPV